MADGTLKQILADGTWRQNTGLVVLLGLCPLLAVTNTVINGLALGLATMLTLMLSNLSVSLMRGLLRPEIRIPAFVLIIASVVTVIELLMHAFFYDLYRVLGIFIPLIVTNCAIIGRAEAFASRNSPIASLVDGFATGLGFCITLFYWGPCVNCSVAEPCYPVRKCCWETGAGTWQLPSSPNTPDSYWPCCHPVHLSVWPC